MAMSRVSSLPAASLASGNPNNSTSCHEPNANELASMLAHAIAEDPSLAVNARDAFPLPLGTSAEVVLRSEKYKFTTHAHLMLQCPRYVLNAMEPAIESRALCPWRYVLQGDTNRYPRDILFVQCECEECVDPELGAFSTHRDLCRPVIHNQHVLRRTGECIDGVYRYEHQFEPVPMACVCDKFTSSIN